MSVERYFRDTLHFTISLTTFKLLEHQIALTTTFPIHCENRTRRINKVVAAVDVHFLQCLTWQTHICDVKYSGEARDTRYKLDTSYYYC